VRGVAPALTQRLTDASAAVAAALVTAQRDNDSVYLQRVPKADQVARCVAEASAAAQSSGTFTVHALDNIEVMRRVAAVATCQLTNA
jgi:hypothetical protein